jgi:hypothetical protein
VTQTDFNPEQFGKPDEHLGSLPKAETVCSTVFIASD